MRRQKPPLEPLRPKMLRQTPRLEQSSRNNSIPIQHPKAQKRPEFRGGVAFRDGNKFVYCKECKTEWSYAGWKQHFSTYHPSDEDKRIDDNARDDGNDDADQLR